MRGSDRHSEPIVIGQRVARIVVFAPGNVIAGVNFAIVVEVARQPSTNHNVCLDSAVMRRIVSSPWSGRVSHAIERLTARVFAVVVRASQKKKYESLVLVT